MNNFDFSALMRSRLFWYAVSASSAAILAVAPVAGKWNRAATEIGFMGSAVSLGAAYWLGKDAEIQITNLAVRRHIQGQVEIDMLTHGLNELRAINYQEIALMIGTEDRLQLPGLPTLPQLPGGAIAQLPAAQSDPLEIQVEDLAKTIASCDSEEQNFLFVGKSRSGKTSLLVNAIAQKDAINSGNVDWFVFNGKPEKDNDWGGLRNSPNDYWAVNSEAKALEMFSQLKSCVKALQEWQDTGDEHYPMVVIADEINNQRILLPDDKTCKQLDQKISLFATQCMSEQSGLWLSMHSHNVEDAGLNRKLQQSFQIVALGRNGKYESIEAILDDQYSIRSKETRDRLKLQLKNYIATGDNGSIAFTNTGGSPRLVKLPYYSKEITLQRNALNAPSGDLISNDTVTPPHNSGTFTADLRRNTGNVPASSREDAGNIPQIPDRQHVETLEALWELEYTDREQIEPLPKGKQNTPKNDYERYLAIRKGRKSGKSKTELIQSVFGVSGGGNGLDKWREEFDSLIMSFGGDWITSLIATGHCHEQIIDQCFAVSVSRQSDFKRRFPQTWQRYINHIEEVAKGA